MQAHHPLTGQPIRILKTGPTLCSDAKTLVWIRDSFLASERWARWSVAISEPAAVERCGAAAVGVVALGVGARSVDWTGVWESLFSAGSACFFVAPATVVESFEAAGLKAGRTLITEDLYDSYPFLGEPIKAADPLAKTVVSMAHILRMNRLAWSVETADRDAMDTGLRAQLDAWMRACGGSVKTLGLAASDSIIPRCWLIQQYYVDNNGRRAREIKSCLEKNLACAYVDHILLLNESNYDLPAHPKLQTQILPHRLRYSDVLRAIKSVVPAGDYVVFANSDIWLNDTLSHLWRLPLVERRLFLALLRWEDIEEPTIFGPRADSQDTWILARDSVDFEISDDDYGFPFGKPGCDNAITLLMMKQRFVVANPAYSIKTMHLHTSAIRHYNPRDVLYKTHFLYVDPTHIQSFAVVTDMSDKKKYGIGEDIGKALGGTCESFARPILASRDPNDVATLCAMLQRSTWNYSAADANLWTPAPGKAPLYKLSGGTFVSGGGMVSNFREIFVGGHESWQKAWLSEGQTTLTPCAHVPDLIAYPFKAEWSKDLGKWALHYLPRALRIRQAVYAGSRAAPEFLVPQIDTIGSFLADCEWKDESTLGNVTVVPYMEDMNYYADTVWAVPPMSDYELPTKSDIELLRSLMPVAPKWVGAPIAVFCVEDSEDAICTRTWAESVADNLFHTGWTTRYVGADDLPSVRRKAFSDASWIFGSGGALDWIWLSGEGATVMEFNSEAEPEGSHIHLAGAAGLRYVSCVQKHREPVVNQRQNALLDIAAAVEKYGFRELINSPVLTSRRPVLVLPDAAALSGIWSHSGDTFREMAEIWGERGYVTLERSTSSGFCWWGGIGQILLYDRPTPRWWNAAAPPSYQMALFGNCAPPGPGPHSLKQSVWCFWGRSPRLLEELARRVQNMRGYESRSIQSLFLGKIENGVQHAARTKHDWSRCVELFSMPVDSTGAAYPFTQAEYLEKLCSARYGLCLAGYGPKCNREIEYFCCGVVPIVAPDVDMKNYLVPPVEGVHYFRAESPADVERIIRGTAAEKWAAMSAAGREWWRLYASADGLFRLTRARVEQCRPYFGVGLPAKFIV
jgi:hypothetical protein